MAGAILLFGEAEGEGNVLMDLAEPDNEAKKQKRPGQRLEREGIHCFVAQSSQIHTDMLVLRALH